MMCHSKELHWIWDASIVRNWGGYLFCNVLQSYLSVRFEKLIAVCLSDAVCQMRTVTTRDICYTSLEKDCMNVDSDGTSQ